MGMTMPEFIRSIDSCSLDKLIGYRFDEISVLYSIIGTHAEIISLSEDNTKAASFTLLMESEEEAIRVCRDLDGLIFNSYNTRYLINLSRNGCSVNAVLTHLGIVYQAPEKPKNYSE